MFVLWSEGQFAVKITIPQNTSFAEGYLLFTTARFAFSEKIAIQLKMNFFCFYYCYADFGFFHCYSSCLLACCNSFISSCSLYLFAFSSKYRPGIFSASSTVIPTSFMMDATFSSVILSKSS